MKVYPMNFNMKPEENIDNIEQTTIEAIKNGIRTSTTRTYWGNHGLPLIGDIIRFVNFENGDSVYVKVTKVTKVPKRLSKAFTDQWVIKERWNLATAINKNYLKGYQVEFTTYLD